MPPFWGGGAGSPSNTMWPGPRSTSVQSFILIHPTVWQQYTNVTDRLTRQTDRQRSPKNASFHLHKTLSVTEALVSLVHTSIKLYHPTYDISSPANNFMAIETILISELVDHSFAHLHPRTILTDLITHICDRQTDTHLTASSLGQPG